jgi:hypothetical protein
LAHDLIRKSATLGSSPKAGFFRDHALGYRHAAAAQPENRRPRPAAVSYAGSIDPDATSEEKAVAVSSSLSSRRNDVMARPLTDIGRIDEMTDETQASRLLALAIAALESGDPKAASELTALAMQFMDRAVSARGATSSVVQQQQQVQPKSDDNED